MAYRNDRRADYRAMIISLLMQRDGNRCGICNDEVDIADIHIDHIVPIADGGGHGAANIRLAHAYCNLSNNPYGRGHPRIALRGSE